MITQKELNNIIDSQQNVFKAKITKVEREILSKISVIPGFANIIMGIRRCGKSTLMLQLLKKESDQLIYLNFEDIRLVGFDQSDFLRLEQVIKGKHTKILYFDEIQLVDKWEIFAHQLLNEGYQVFITGSNASLLSKELGTHLTGRHLSLELMPFSFNEFLAFHEEKPTSNNLSRYLKVGGMPEYVKYEEPQILMNLINDILFRDIAVRHGIRDVETLKKLTVYLISNIGRLVSANKLTDVFGIKSATTILEYFGYLSDSYLVEFLPIFSYSIKTQNRNPKKVYTLDNGIAETISLSFSEDEGRKLENLVYQHLRRKGLEIYYFKDKKECDFVVREKNSITHLIQVCYDLSMNNQQREINGLLEAMSYFDVSRGTIVTFDQKDEFIFDDKTIEVIPAHFWLMHF
jgi:predicted AAA+ superfamily ATPase